MIKPSADHERVVSNKIPTPKSNSKNPEIYTSAFRAGKYRGTIFVKALGNTKCIMPAKEYRNAIMYKSICSMIQK